MKFVVNSTFFLVVITAYYSCNANRNKATLDSTQDTTSVNRAGSGNPIKDTATINKERRDSTSNGIDTVKNRNANPSGHFTPTQKTQH
jgi:hypothetical protein